MRKRSTPQKTITRKTHSQLPAWQCYAMAAVCCSVLATGFFFAARQHFSSVDFGIKNSRLRKQLDELQSEKRRLLLTKEITMSPTEIRRAARRVGFIDTPAVAPESIKISTTPLQKLPGKVVEASVRNTSAPGNKIVPTVMSVPSAKPIRAERQAKTDTTRERKDRT